MVSIFRRLLGHCGSQTADPLARDIADSSVSETRRRLRTNVSTMSVAELRGYVRARAMRPVREQTRQLVAGHGRQIVSVDNLNARALERTVQIVVRQLARKPLADAREGLEPRRKAS